MSTDYNSAKISAFLYSNDDWNDIQAWVSHGGEKSLTVHLDSLSATDCIDIALCVMADKAVRIWPQWYGDGVLTNASSHSFDERLHSFLTVLELCRRNRNIELAWIKKAVHLVSIGKPPLVMGFVGEVQVRQLALVLMGCIANVTLIVSKDLGEPHDCNGFPRAVEWLSRESGLDVTVLLPKEMATNEDLTPLLYGVGSWRDKKLAEKHDAATDEVIVPSLIGATSFPVAPRIPDEDAPEAERIIGVPHPRSRGEQLLAERLLRDPQLSGLFGHNQPVSTYCGRKFIVDLLWRAGGVVVEIDGYWYHNNSVAFAGDRDRDYRLLVSGYRVLRLTHDEVVRDVDLALEKIRDVVNFVRLSGSEAKNDR